MPLLTASYTSTRFPSQFTFTKFQSVHYRCCKVTDAVGNCPVPLVRFPLALFLLSTRRCNNEIMIIIALLNYFRTPSAANRHAIIKLQVIVAPMRERSSEKALGVGRKPLSIPPLRPSLRRTCQALMSTLPILCLSYPIMNLEEE